MQCGDCYHMALAYLFSLDNNCYHHIADVFDFQNDSIILTAFEKEWQTGTSLKVTRLAYNLWNNWNDGTSDYSVGTIFSCSYAPYFWEAIRIRFPEYTG